LFGVLPGALSLASNSATRALSSLTCAVNASICACYARIKVIKSSLQKARRVSRVTDTVNLKPRHRVKTVVQDDRAAKR